MTPTRPFRLSVVPLVVLLGLSGCTSLLQPDPLNKTESIVNGTQVTRGPSRGGVRGGADSGFASTLPPVGNTFEPAVGESFGLDELAAAPGNDTLLPELQDIDFGAERTYVSDIATDIAASGGLAGDGTLGGAESSAEYFAANIGQAVYFATDSSELTERARETLRRQAAWLNVNEGARVTIEGHADERGTREYNLALGERRASATRGYLIAVGVDGNRIDKISYGKERPVALGSDETAWAQNRRTETVLDDAGEGFAFDPPGTVLPVDTASLPPVQSEPYLANDLFLDAPAPNTVEAAAVDPLFATPIANDILATPGLAPGSVTYGTITEPVAATPVFDSGTIAPGVFDTGPVTSAPSIGTVAPVTSATGPTRIQDVTVDDLLRDPSLIDRIGTPGASTPGT